MQKISKGETKSTRHTSNVPRFESLLLSIKLPSFAATFPPPPSPLRLASNRFINSLRQNDDKRNYFTQKNFSQISFITADFEAITRGKCRWKIILLELFSISVSTYLSSYLHDFPSLHSVKLFIG